jgi:DNA-binding GntR family transcriptional regulator
LNRTRNASSKASFWTGSSPTRPPGRDTARPQLTELLQFARDGDTVLVHSMDRLARNLDDLLDLEFHTALVSESGNSRLLRSYTTLATESLICMRNLGHMYPIRSSLTHHRVMAELIATGSMTEIRSAFHHHLSISPAAS